MTYAGSERLGVELEVAQKWKSWTLAGLGKDFIEEMIPQLSFGACIGLSSLFRKQKINW